MPESVNAARFIETAEAFCLLVESSGSLDRDVFFKDCFRAVSRLLTEVVDLPDVGDLLTDSRVADAERAEIVGRLKRQIGDEDYYRMVFDPWEEPVPEVIYG